MDIIKDIMMTAYLFSRASESFGNSLDLFKAIKLVGLDTHLYILRDLVVEKVLGCHHDIKMTDI